MIAKVCDKPAREIKVTGEIEARITQLACSKALAGSARWTLLLLADHLVEIEVIESISHITVGLVFKKRAQTLAAGRMVHPAQAQRRLRSGHGRRAGGLSTAARRLPAVGLPR